MNARWWWGGLAGMFAVGALPWVFAATGSDGHALFEFLCHQRPERTLHLAGEPMAVCSRCAGIHLGLMLGALVALTSRSHPFFRRHGTALVVAALALNVADWAIFQLLPLSHESRLLVGALFGACGVAFMFSALATPATADPQALRAGDSRRLASSRT